MATMHEDSGQSSALLKIQFHVKGMQDCEVVKKSTSKGFDVVQVNGADFFRKRKAPPQPAQPTPNKLRPQAAAAEIAAAMDEGSGIAAAATATAQAVPELAAAALGAVAGAHEMMQGQQQWEAQDEVMHEGDCMDAVLLSHGQYGPGEAYAEASLESIQDQLDRCLPPSCPKVIAVQFALEKLMQHGATQLDRSHGTGIYSQAARQVLNGFTDLLQQQADAARAMLLQVRPPRCFAQSSGSWQGAQAGQATPCASPAPGSKPAVEGTESAPLEQYLKQAPMVRELCSGSVLKAQLQQQLAVLKEEEQAWMNLRRKYAGEEEQAGGQSGPATTGPAAAEAAVDKGSSQAQGAAEAGACEGAVTAEQQAVQEGSGSLKRTEESVNAALKLRVESLYAFLAKVEAMVAKGEQACMMLQADYHQEKFKTFPHVNSPAWLISQIIRKHQVAATEAEEAAADP